MVEKIIEIDLNNKYDLVEKYNENKLSSELIEYMIKQALPIKKKANIKIIINSKCDIDKDCITFLKDGLTEEYDKSIKEHEITNIKQLVLFMIGLLFLFFATLIHEDVIWKEILLIIGWVPIWEVIELELFHDVREKGKRRIIKRLLKAEIIEK